MKNQDSKASIESSKSATKLQAKTDDGEDRFDEFGMGVKKKYRPEWLESENTLFINKLNHVAKHYQDDHKAVSFSFVTL